MVSDSGLYFDRARMANKARRLTCELCKGNKASSWLRKRNKEEYQLSVHVKAGRVGVIDQRG